MDTVNTRTRKAPTPQPDTAQEATADATPSDDFSSIVLTIDHMAAQTRAPAHTIRKWVTSTQTLSESILALLEYYGEQHLLGRSSTLDLFTQAHNSQHPVLIYHTPQNVQIVASADTWGLMIERFGMGSLLQASEQVEALLARHVGAQIAEQGGVVPLSLFSLTTEDPDA